MKRLALTTFVMILTCLTLSADAARPVARWDIVPDQLLDGPFKLGVVALHIDGVQVEFRVNGSLVATVTEPAFNERTGVWEYWFELDPAQYADGALTIDARAICLSGDAVNDPDYDLPTYTLYANSGGTLGSSVVKYADIANGSDSNDGSQAAPYATLAKAVTNTPSGGQVYLMPGTYASNSLGGGSSRPYWTTISAAPGVDRGDVLISAGRPSTQRLRWKNVKIISTSTTGTYSVILTGNGTTTVHYVWLDDVELCNVNGRYAASTNVFNNNYKAFVTGGWFHDITNGPGGWLQRDIQMDTITSDSWSGGSRLVVNCTVTDIDPGTTGAHPDFHQSYTTSPNFVEDVILYNVRGIDVNSQGLFGSRLKNSAFVNVLIDRVSGVYYRSQYSGPMENVLYAHVSLSSQSWMWRGSGDNALAAVDLNVVNNLFSSMSFYEDAAPQPGLIQDYNNFAGGTPYGTNYTSGDQMYLDADNNDFRLDPASPAAGTGRYLQCVPADIDGNLYNPNGRNKGCYAASALTRAGDANGDGSVNLDDFIILKQNYGLQNGASFQQGDFNGDGSVNLDDFIILKQNYGN